MACKLMMVFKDANSKKSWDVKCKWISECSDESYESVFYSK